MQKNIVDAILATWQAVKDKDWYTKDLFSTGID
jgi:hypothetical protein